MVYYFNPTCDMAIANNTTCYMIPKSFSEFEEALEYLPLIFSNQNDVLLVKNKPSTSFINHTLAWKKELPQFLTLDELKTKKHLYKHLSPWGWSPATQHYLAPILSKGQGWDPIYRKLSSRVYALEILQKLQAKRVKHILPETENPIVCFNLEAIEAQIIQRGSVVLKSPWSSAGRGVQMLRKPFLNDSNKQWIKSILTSQKSIMVETLLPKQQDVSFHYYIDPNKKVISLGISFFCTNSNGQYDKSFIHFSAKETVTQHLLHIKDQLQQVIEESLYTTYYQGYLGIDALIYETEQRTTLVHPIVEINMRQSMGLVTLFIEKQISSKSSGFFTIKHFSNEEEKKSVLTQLKKENPLVMGDNYIISGFIELTDILQKGCYAAYVLVHISQEASA